MEEWRLAGIERGLAELDKHLPMSPTMDGRLPLHQDCRELVAEVRRLRELLGNYGYHVEYCPAFDAPPGLPGFGCECGWGEVEGEFTPANGT